MMANPDNEYPRWNVNNADFNSAVASNVNDPLIEDSSGSEDTSFLMDLKIPARFFISIIILEYMRHFVPR